MGDDDQLRVIIGRLIDLILNMSTRIDLLGDALTVIASELMKYNGEETVESSTTEVGGQHN